VTQWLFSGQNDPDGSISQQNGDPTLDSPYTLGAKNPKI